MACAQIEVCEIKVRHGWCGRTRVAWAEPWPQPLWLNWNSDCTSGSLTWHQYLTFRMFLWHSGGEIHIFMLQNLMGKLPRQVKVIITAKGDYIWNGGGSEHILVWLIRLAQTFGHMVYITAENEVDWCGYFSCSNPYGRTNRRGDGRLARDRRGGFEQYRPRGGSQSAGNAERQGGAPISGNSKTWYKITVWENGDLLWNKKYTVLFFHFVLIVSRCEQWLLFIRSLMARNMISGGFWLFCRITAPFLLLQYMWVNADWLNSPDNVKLSSYTQQICKQWSIVFVFPFFFCSSKCIKYSTEGQKVQFYVGDDNAASALRSISRRITDKEGYKAWWFPTTLWCAWVLGVWIVDWYLVNLIDTTAVNI